MDVVGFLLERKCAVNQTDFGGETPLHWAALSGHKQVMEMLLDAGARYLTLECNSYVLRLNAQADNGYTPLHSATVNCHPDCVTLLLNRAADSSLKDKTSRKLRMYDFDCLLQIEQRKNWPKREDINTFWTTSIRKRESS